LSSSIRLGGNSKRAFVRGGAPFGNPDASERVGGTVETELVG